MMLEKSWKSLWIKWKSNWKFGTGLTFINDQIYQIINKLQQKQILKRKQVNKKYNKQDNLEQDKWS